MKQYILLIFISSLLLFSLTFSYSSSHSKETHRKSNIVGSTVDDQDASVEIREKLDEKENVIKRNFNHPYNFTEAGLADLLSTVYYKVGKDITDKSERKVFWDEELQNIIPPIISAFSMANDSQDILVFSSPHKGLLADSQSYFSMFITGNDLNIVFSTIQSKKSFTDGKSFRKSNKAKFEDPFDVKRSSRWSLVPMGGQRFAPGRQNWLIIDLSSNLFGVASTDNANISDNTNDISIPSDRSRAIERKVRTGKSFIEEKKNYQDVREKLKELKVLSDEGLISEKDYELKKKELLNKF
ncbi:MAG: hypothetical protein R2549_04680 [Candidatus Scalindua sp.]|nr:hypothetical protein [Candidatus Scalindua sp.]